MEPGGQQAKPPIRESSSAVKDSTMVNMTPGKTAGPTLTARPQPSMARAQLRRNRHGREPDFLRGSLQRIADEVSYIGSLPNLDDGSKTRLVRLFSDEERAMLLEGLKLKLHQTEAQFHRELAKEKSPPSRSKVKEIYEPEILQIHDEIAQLSREYIFVDCD